MNIARRANGTTGRMAAWRRAAAWSAGLALAAALVLCGCGGPDWSGGGGKSFDLNGTLTFSGPIPVYQAYDGVNPLVSYMRAGLLKPGTNTLTAFLDYYRETGDPFGLNVTGSYQFGQMFWEDMVPAGTYDFALYSEDPSNSDWLQLGSTAQHIAYRGLQATIDYGAGSQQLSPMAINFTGPGPYGSASGRVLVSGDSSPMVQLVIKPAHPRPGVSADTGLLWQANSQYASHGQVWFTIPDLSYGEYELSYAGSSIHDRDAPLEVGSLHFTISAEQPNAEDLNFKVTDAWEVNPSWELGHISGTFTLPVAPAAGAAYCVEARLLNPSSGGAASNYEQAAWLATADDFDAARTAAFDLRWLTAGQYSITVYELAGAPDGQDTALTVFGPYTLPADSHELTGVALEVQP